MMTEVNVTLDISKVRFDEVDVRQWFVYQNHLYFKIRRIDSKEEGTFNAVDINESRMINFSAYTPVFLVGEVSIVATRTLK